MARPLRVRYEGATYHVYARGNRKERIFFEEEDFRYFLKRLERGSLKYNVDIHAYCILENHFHLLITTRDANISRFMHFLLSSYANYLSRRGWVGHVFAGRYQSQVVEEPVYLCALARYIHLNPVKAGMVDSPDDYPWSSWDSYMEIAAFQKDQWLKRNLILSQFGEDTRVSIRRFRNFVLEGLSETVDFPEDRIVMGAFIGDINGSFRMDDDTRCIPLDIVGRRRLIEAISLDELLKRVMAHYDVNELSIENWFGKDLRKRTREARKAFIFLAKELSSASNREIAEVVGGLGVSAVSESHRRMRGAWEKQSGMDERTRNLCDELLGRNYRTFDKNDAPPLFGDEM